MKATPIPFLVAAMLACGACGSGQSSRTTELPGFEITLPAGTVKKSTTHPGTGAHEVEYGVGWRAALPEIVARVIPAKKGIIKISWRAGAQTAEDLIEYRHVTSSMMSGIAGAAGASFEIDDNRWLDVLVRNGQPLNMGYAYCAPGLMITVVHASGLPAKEQTRTTRRIVESIICQVGESVPALPDPNLNLPPDFGRAVSADSALYFSPSGISVAASNSHNDLHAEPEVLRQILQNLAQQMFQTNQAPALKMDEVRRPDLATSMLGELVMPGAEERAFIATLYCPEFDFTILSYIMGPTIDSATARGIAKRMDCSFSPQNVRSVSEVFRDACDAGQASACRDLSTFIEEGSAHPDRGTAAELRAKACALGDAESCKT